MQNWKCRSCGKVPVRLLSGTWVATAPESRQCCLVFVDLFAGGGARQRQQWQLIPLPTRAGRRWQTVWQSPCLGFVAETGRFVAMETPWIRFSFLLAFVPCFLLFVFHFSFLSYRIIFPASRYVYLLRVPSSVQQSSATLSRYVFYSTCAFCLCHLYLTPSGNSFIFYSFSIIFHRSISRVTFFFVVVVSYPVYASDWFVCLEPLAFVFFSVSLSVTTEFVSPSRMKNQEEHWGYCWCR